MNEPTPSNEISLALEDEPQLVDATGKFPLPMTEDGPWQDGELADGQEDYERRQVSNDRSPPPDAKGAAAPRLVNGFVQKLRKSRPMQGGMVVATLVAFALIYYTATERMMLIDGAFEQEVRRGELETELMTKNRVWSDERIQSLRDNIESADRRRVFLDYATLADWLRGERDIAESLGLEFQYKLNNHDTSRMANVDEVTVTVEVNVPSSHDPVVFMDLMQFVRALVTTPWYLEFVGAELVGDGDSATKLTAELRLWVHDKVNDHE
ncbi:MAG: hypothetical protein AAF610_13970 [Pseudomonadota bacterium]